MRMLFLGLVALMALTLTTAVSAQEALFLIRHADKEAGTNDPGLTAQGRQRAADWAHMLGEAGITVVIHTDARRSRQTAQIIADGLNAEQAEYAMADLAGLTDLLEFDYPDRTVLVIAHTETIPGIQHRLGIDQPHKVADDDFASLFVIPAPGRIYRLRMP